VTVAGGGETIQAARQFGVAGRLSHISTGGGASLKYLEGKPLAAIEVLDRK
ncbi:MAG TPA: phosphoglycerate kinase, partial [bacterium]|nr:phosphoglycerate kinase [bacterium]